MISRGNPLDGGPIPGLTTVSDPYQPSGAPAHAAAVAVIPGATIRWHPGPPEAVICRHPARFAAQPALMRRCVIVWQDAAGAAGPLDRVRGPGRRPARCPGQQIAVVVVPDAHDLGFAARRTQPQTNGKGQRPGREG